MSLGTSYVGRMAGLLTDSAFNHIAEYASSSGIYRALYCYAELAVSSPAVIVNIASTHFAYPQRNGQAELVSTVD